MSKIKNDNRGRTSVKFKVNQIENSIRLLDTHELQFKNLWVYKEFGWLIKYLFETGISDEEVYTVWKLIYVHNFEDILSEDELKIRYIKIKDSIGKIDLFTGNEIVFYQDEVDYINSLFGPKWIKEYFLVLLGYFKFMGWNNCFVPILDIPRNILLTKFTSMKKQGDHEIQAIYKFATIHHLWEVNDSGRILLLFSREQGHEVLRINTSADLWKICTFVKNEMTCRSCGSIFEYGSKCKRDICLDCWEKQNKLKRNDLMRKKYNSEKEFLFTINEREK